MRVLTFTSLYPNKIQPRHGIFVHNRMAYFDRIDGTSRKVIAPVQYFPLLGLWPNSKFHHYNQIAKTEIQGEIPVYHPRYITLPGTNIINAAEAMARSADKIIAGDDFDLVDGHYLYPDGVAASKIAKAHDKPLVLTARGSDVNFWMEQDGPKKDIMSAIDHARKVICVSEALKDRLISHGVDRDKLTVIMNGVDRGFFTAKDTGKCKYLLSVGNLVPLKGHDIILRMLVNFPGEKLIIIGAGAQEASLKTLARELAIEHQVTFLPPVPHGDLAAYYTDAKCTILMSSMEGMPNVILESLASGTPIIATNVGGIPEVVTANNGILLPERTPDALTHGLTEMLGRDWDRPHISQDMAYLDWHETARKLHDLFSEIL